MLNARLPWVRAFAFPLVAACLVSGSGTAFASSLIGTRNTSITFEVDAKRTAYIVGLTESEASKVTGSNFLSVIRPFDAEKAGPNDVNYCWAAANANMLAYTGWGSVGTLRTEYDIYSYYTTMFTNKGSDPYYGLQWFINGTYPVHYTWTQWAQLRYSGSGGFLRNANLRYGYVDISNRGAAGLNSALSYLQNDYAVAFTLGSFYNGQHLTGHVLTLWGVTYDSITGNILSILVSDSDNNYGRGGANAPDTLDEIFLKYNASGNYYSLLNYSFIGGYSDNRLLGFTYLSKMPSLPTIAYVPAIPAVPEPPIYLMFGFGIISMALMRRKKVR